jgi:hypothetical protein
VLVLDPAVAADRVPVPSLLAWRSSTTACPRKLARSRAWSSVSDSARDTHEVAPTSATAPTPSAHGSP